MVERKLVQIGEAIPGHSFIRGDQPSEDRIVPENKTVLEILDIPAATSEMKQLVRSIYDRYYAQGHTGVMIMSGENLADDPRIAQIVDPTKMYVLEI